MKKKLRNNGLSIALFGLFFFTIVGHFLAGHAQYNEEQRDKGKPEAGFVEYAQTGHFVESVFENWESEFLQMGVYVALTAFLFQVGSPESKSPDEPEEVDREPDPKRKGAPWPVRVGGFWCKLYSSSLTSILLLLFALSFVFHAVGGAMEYNDERKEQGKHPVSVIEFAGSSKMWFQSFQNWQSEFLSMFTLIVLSIYLRQKGSAESKPVDAPHSETGGPD